MTRTLSVLFVLSIFVLSLCGAAFGANAAYDKASRSAEVGLSATHWNGDQLIDNPGSNVASKPQSTAPSSLGYYMFTKQVGYSTIDHQSNPGRNQRQIAVGCSGNIHNVFMYAEVDYWTGGSRNIRYVANVPPSNPPLPTDIGPLTSGYASIATDPINGFAIMAYHWTSPDATFGRSTVQAGMQTSCAGLIFGLADYPVAPASLPARPNCQNIQIGIPGTIEEGYIWPSVASDLNTVSGRPIAHILTCEYAGGTTSPGRDTTGRYSLVYYKSTDDVVAPSATCGTFLDSVASSSYEIVASPVAASNKVAAVYFYPRSWMANKFARNWGDNDDIVYRESNDAGATWGPRTTVKHFTNAEDSIVASDGSVMCMRANEMSPLYDNNECLHVLYTTMWNDTAGHTYLIYPAKLFHWSSCNSGCQSLVKDASDYGSNNSCRPPGYQLNISKPSLSECLQGGNRRLYAVYLLNPDYLTADSTYTDCGAAASSGATRYVNYEIFAQGSTSLNGDLWGNPVNLSNTRSDNCLTGACFAEGFTSTAEHVSDSIRIQYMVDKSPGDYIYAQGGAVINPIMNMSYPCFTVATDAVLSADPVERVWPFHTTPAAGPNHTASFPIKLTNVGNISADYVRTVAYTPAGSWLTFDVGGTSSVPAGCTNFQTTNVTATGPGTEGVFKATITWSWLAKTLNFPVELYNFNTWNMEANLDIRTSTVRMVTDQNSRAAAQKPHGYGFHYASDHPDTNYLFDGSVLMGTDSLHMSTAIFSDSTGFIGSFAGRIGRLFCTSGMSYDSINTSFRHSWGVGCNRDSSVAFDVDFYAPKAPDSADFMVAKIAFYAGPKNPAATINNMMISYACDFDVPDDSSDNQAGTDELRQMVYQQGRWGSNTTRYAALAGIRGDNNPLEAGFVQDNNSTVYRVQGYVNDTMWKKIQTSVGYTAFAGTAQDLNSMLVFAKSATITPKATGTFDIYVILAGQPRTGGSLAGLQAAVDAGKKFLCAHGVPTVKPAWCAATGCVDCGDANSDGAVDISDAVFLIQYIFAGGAAPGSCNYAFGKGDANGDCTVDISDAVYLIQYIFAGGAAPHCGVGCK